MKKISHLIQKVRNLWPKICCALSFHTPDGDWGYHAHKPEAYCKCKHCRNWITKKQRDL